MTLSMQRLAYRIAPVLALVLLFAAMDGRWRVASASPPAAAFTTGTSDDARPAKKSAKELTGKVNLNTATAEQLILLPTIGPAKAERIITWRKKNGGFRRIADLRRVKGIGYKTFKRLAPFLAVKGETTLR